MLGTGLQFGRGQGEDRFYDPLKARRNQHHYPPQNQNQNQNQNQFRKSINKNSNNLVPIKGKSVILDTLGKQEIQVVEEVSKPAPDVAEVDAEVEVPAGLSNLDRFLESTTPSIPAQYISTTRMRGLRTCDVEYRPYFKLDDLWESFKEWSAYGAGVPLVLNDCDSVVQYYVPYLSGVQIYVESARLPNSRRPGDDNDYFRDSSSDGSSDSDFEMRLTDAALGMDRLSLRDNRTSLQDNSSSDDSETGNSRGHLLFEYLERNPPYSREPLADKILDLACRFPDLKTLRSCDLLESSWISVAWYPIYRIPTGPTLKDLDACFLTFHPLSTPMTGAGTMQSPTITYPNGVDGVHKMTLPIFGLASYKLKGSMWIPSGGSECQQSNSLLQAADSWLRVRQVNHPDFQFFASHGTIRR